MKREDEPGEREGAVGMCPPAALITRPRDRLRTPQRPMTGKGRQCGNATIRS